MAYTSGTYSSPYLGSSTSKYSPYQDAMQAGIRKRRMYPYGTHAYGAVPNMMGPQQSIEPPSYREPYWADPELRNPGAAAPSQVNPLQSVMPQSFRGPGPLQNLNFDTGQTTLQPGYIAQPQDWWPQWMKDQFAQQQQQQQAPEDVNALVAVLRQRGII